MEPEGIRNGSTINDLRIRTATITGKKEREKSIYQGILAVALIRPGVAECFPEPSENATLARLGASSHASNNQTAPVTTAAITRTAAKSNCILVTVLLLNR
jgi:hypothetical protein